MSDSASAETTGAVTGGLRTLLRLEGLTLFAGMTLLYAVWGGSWWIVQRRRYTSQILWFWPRNGIAASAAG